MQKNPGGETRPGLLSVTFQSAELIFSSLRPALPE